MSLVEYITYVVIFYQLASTACVIHKTRSLSGLENAHKVLIINMMVSDIVGVIDDTFQTIRMISYIIDIRNAIEMTSSLLLHYSRT